MTKILRLPEVIALTGYKRASIYAKVKDNTFPPPIKLCDNGRAVGWLKPEIEKWVAERIEASRGAHA